MKALLLLAVAMLSSSSSSYAYEVYSSSSGRWILTGDQSSPADNVCLVSSRWPDGKQINVNVYPKVNGTNNVTMTVFNPDWDNSNWRSGTPFSVDVVFQSSKYGTLHINTVAQIYNRTKVIFRRPKQRLANAFIHYDRMILFAGDSEELSVNLKGTAGIAAQMPDCIQAVLGDYYGGFGENDIY